MKNLREMVNKMRQIKITLRKFKNISGKNINVLCKLMFPEQEREFEVPNATQGRQDQETYIVGKRQEIINLIAYKYIMEIPIDETSNTTLQTTVATKEQSVLREYGLIDPLRD
jgi:hypothetical protein